MSKHIFCDRTGRLSKHVAEYIVKFEIGYSKTKQRRDNIFRKQSEYEPTSYETVRINLFNGVTVA
ncbi:MAG: hypothetical protein UE068_10585, partial [Paludibacteraceae bacterium]|nr:hypothetical protein [Paludibacteraceae bacterium]